MPIFIGVQGGLNKLMSRKPQHHASHIEDAQKLAFSWAH